MSELFVKQKSESIRIIFFSLTKVLEKEESNSVYHKVFYSKKNSIIHLFKKTQLEHIETESWMKPENENEMKHFFLKLFWNTSLISIS